MGTAGHENHRRSVPEAAEKHDLEQGEAPTVGQKDPGVSSACSDPGNDPTIDVHLRNTFHQSADEGVARMSRSWPDLLATGLVGGMDVSLGILAMLVVEHATGSHMLGALAFSIGFIAIALGRSELFTENFLVPVASLATGRASVGRLLRLWAGTAVTNLLGGWFFAWLIATALPRLHPTILKVAEIYPALPLEEAIALGMIAGAAITFMTWMERGARSEVGRLVAVTAIGFLLSAAHLNHVVVVSIEMFAAIHTGDAHHGYLDWLRLAGIATISNMLGGLVLVTVFRLVQVGREEIQEERQRVAREP